MQAAAKIAEKVVASVSKLGNVLANSMKVGAPPVTINQPTMAMDVRKDTSESLVTKTIESDIGNCKIDGLLDVGEGCVSAKVYSTGWSSKKLHKV